MTAREETERLQEAAMSTLSRIISLTQRLLEANRSNDQKTIAQLDRELEH